MDDLCKFTKDDCGVPLFCFVEVKDKLFPNVPKSTVKSWLRELKITCKHCPEDQRLFFKDSIPDLRGAFGTIDMTELNRLIEYSTYKRGTGPPLLRTDHEATTSGDISGDISGDKSNLDVIVVDESSNVDLPIARVDSSVVKASTPPEIVNCSASPVEIRRETNLCTKPLAHIASVQTAQVTRTSTVTQSQTLPACRETRRSKRYSLPDEQITGDLRQELKEFAEFYTSSINPSRPSCSLTKSTMDKVRERLLCFLGFVKIYAPFEILTLNCTGNVKFIDEYVRHLSRNRELLPSTISRHLSALLSVIKYTRRNESNVDTLPEIIAVRNVQRQLSREAEVCRKRKREGFGAGGGNDNAFLFSHILDAIRKLRDEYYNTAGISSSRHLHDFTLLTLYIRVLPGRCQELRTLKIIDHTLSDRKFQTANVDGLNALVFEPDGGITLIETDFKTVKSMGPSKIDLSDDEWLTYFVKTYVQKHRETLLLGKGHDFMFMNRYGQPFLSSASMSKYISDLFERVIGQRASCTKMRHAIVSYFFEMPESENEKLRESLASLLKHSTRMQQHVYRDTKRQQKVQMGRDFLRGTLMHADLFSCEESELAAVKNAADADESAGCTSVDDLLPQLGEICALLDPASNTRDDALIFVAKVVRYTPDKSRVCLQELEKLDNSSDLYRAKCSSVWWENSATLVYPVDICYNAAERAYQLRTTPAEIYDDVKASGRSGK